MHKQSFTVTSANTAYGKAISTPEAISLFAGSDILLLQEVLSLDKATVAAHLGHIGLNLAAFDSAAGLAIAVSDRFTALKSATHQLQPASRIASAAALIGMGPRFRERNLLVASLIDGDGNEIVATTTHPIVCVRPFSRSNQITELGKILATNYSSGRLILGADLNHYPSPNQVDEHMAYAAELEFISDKQPTCLLLNTKHAWLKHFGLPDARLDSMLFRGISEVSSSTLPIQSDHLAVQAEFVF